MPITQELQDQITNYTDKPGINDDNIVNSIYSSPKHQDLKGAVDHYRKQGLTSAQILDRMMAAQVKEIVGSDRPDSIPPIAQPAPQPVAQPTTQPKEPGFWAGANQDLVKRGVEIADTVRAPQNLQEMFAPPLPKAVHAVAQVPGFAADIATRGAESLYKNLAPKSLQEAIANPKPGQRYDPSNPANAENIARHKQTGEAFNQGVQALSSTVNSAKENFPNATRAVEDIADIATGTPILKGASSLVKSGMGLAQKGMANTARYGMKRLLPLSADTGTVEGRKLAGEAALKHDIPVAREAGLTKTKQIVNDWSRSLDAHIAKAEANGAKIPITDITDPLETLLATYEEGDMASEAARIRKYIRGYAKYGDSISPSDAQSIKKFIYSHVNYQGGGLSKGLTDARKVAAKAMKEGINQSVIGATEANKNLSDVLRLRPYQEASLARIDQQPMLNIPFIGKKGVVESNLQDIASRKLYALSGVNPKPGGLMEMLTKKRSLGGPDFTPKPRPVPQLPNRAPGVMYGTPPEPQISLPEQNLGLPAPVQPKMLTGRGPELPAPDRTPPVMYGTPPTPQKMLPDPNKKLLQSPDWTGISPVDAKPQFVLDDEWVAQLDKFLKGEREKSILEDFLRGGMR